MVLSPLFFIVKDSSNDSFPFPAAMAAFPERTSMELITSFLMDWGYAALFVIMVLENMNVPIPSEIVLGFAGFLVSQDIFSYWPAVMVGTAAGLAGSLGSYWLGSAGGRSVLLRYGRYMHLSESHLIAADSWFQRYGGIAVFTGRLLPGIRTFISLPAGMARYPLPHFIFYTIIGTIPWTMLLVYLGALLGDNWQLLTEYDMEFLAASVLLVLLILGGYWLFHRKKHQ